MSAEVETFRLKIGRMTNFSSRQPMKNVQTTVQISVSQIGRFIRL